MGEKNSAKSFNKLPKAKCGLRQEQNPQELRHRAVCTYLWTKLLSWGRLEEGNACHCKWSRESYLDLFPLQNKSPNACEKGQQTHSQGTKENTLQLGREKKELLPWVRGRKSSYPWVWIIRDFPLPKDKGLLRKLLTQDWVSTWTTEKALGPHDGQQVLHGKHGSLLWRGGKCMEIAIQRHG